MANREVLLGPIVVGGMGGSGTRVIAEILMNMGFYMGNDLNSANDNVCFTFLFKRPQWYARCQGRKSEILKGLSIFYKAMHGGFFPDADESFFIMKVLIEIFLGKHNYARPRRKLWPIRRVLKMVDSKKFDSSAYRGWGWKEPNSHIYIEYLTQYFHTLKYVHVVRHGLDMAYSRNQSQLYNWGSIFGVQIPKSGKLLPKASLSYWIRSNEAAISRGKRLLGDNFLLMNFDELCLYSKRELKEFTQFLGIDNTTLDMKRLSSLIEIPPSMGRHKSHDLSIFDETEVEAVRKLGFRV